LKYKLLQIKLRNIAFKNNQLLQDYRVEKFKRGGAGAQDFDMAKVGA